MPVHAPVNLGQLVQHRRALALPASRILPAPLRIRATPEIDVV